MRAVFRSHFARYPQMTPQDAVKLAYQSAFGPGHLLADPQRARAFLGRELEETPARPGEVYEPIGNGYARLHLAAAKAADMPEEEIFQAFFRAAGEKTPGKAAFEQNLSLLEELAAQGQTPFSAAELAGYLAEYRAAGCPMVSHSQTFRERYHPAYRVVRMILETERLYLREMTENDFEALYNVLADSDIMRHYPYTFDEARVRNWIQRNIDRYRIFGFGLWAVCLKETGEMIGDCGLTMQLVNGQIKPEIGYHIRADKQRSGYAKEAARAVRDWTFQNTPFRVVYSYMKHTNVPSCRTAIAYGCRQVDAFEDDVNEITKVFAISRDEWTNR